MIDRSVDTCPSSDGEIIKTLYTLCTESLRSSNFCYFQLFSSAKNIAKGYVVNHQTRYCLRACAFLLAENLLCSNFVTKMFIESVNNRVVILDDFNLAWLSCATGCLVYSILTPWFIQQTMCGSGMTRLDNPVCIEASTLMISIIIMSLITL